MGNKLCSVWEKHYCVQWYWSKRKEIAAASVALSEPLNNGTTMRYCLSPSWMSASQGWTFGLVIETTAASSLEYRVWLHVPATAGGGRQQWWLKSLGPFHLQGWPDHETGSWFGSTLALAVAGICRPNQRVVVFCPSNKYKRIKIVHFLQSVHSLGKNTYEIVSNTQRGHMWGYCLSMLTWMFGRHCVLIYVFLLIVPFPPLLAWKVESTPFRTLSESPSRG